MLRDDFCFQMQNPDEFKTFPLSTGSLFSYSLLAGMVFTGAEAQPGTSSHSGGAGLLITMQRVLCRVRAVSRMKICRVRKREAPWRT